MSNHDGHIVIGAKASPNVWIGIMMCWDQDTRKKLEQMTSLNREVTAYNNKGRSISHAFETQPW